MRHQRISQEESYLCRCSMTFPVDQKTMNKNAWRMPDSFLCMQRDLEQDNGHSLDLDQKEVVLYQWRQPTRNLGQNCRKDAFGICWNRMSDFQCYDSVVQRSTQKQRTWKTVDSLCCHSGNNWNCFSHNCFCKSAQSSRSSREDVWRIWIPSRKIRATW